MLEKSVKTRLSVRKSLTMSLALRTEQPAQIVRKIGHGEASSAG